MADNEHIREHIQLAIERAREGVGEHIDELDQRLRSNLDFQQMAGDHVPQIIAAGVGLGFLIGFGVPRVLVRAIQIGVPVLLAVQVARSQMDSADSGNYPIFD